ncbi:hypothetical protein Tco_0121464 [Tanacetum coccineum]
MFPHPTTPHPARRGHSPPHVSKCGLPLSAETISGLSRLWRYAISPASSRLRIHTYPHSSYTRHYDPLSQCYLSVYFNHSLSQSLRLTRASTSAILVERPGDIAGGTRTTIHAVFRANGNQCRLCVRLALSGVILVKSGAVWNSEYDMDLDPEM